MSSGQVRNFGPKSPSKLLPDDTQDDVRLYTTGQHLFVAVCPTRVQRASRQRPTPLVHQLGSEARLIPGESMRILLADDQPILRMGLMTLLRQIGKHVVFHEAETHPEVLSMAATHSPHVALMNLSLAGVFTFDLIRHLKKHAPDTHVLIVSMQDEMFYAERALKAGARGYAMKNWSSQTVLQAVNAVAQGKVWFSEQFQTRVIEKMMTGREGSAQGLASLSDRELTVFQMIGAGLKKSDIARRLNLSPNTVETYRSHIKHKLGVESGAELSRMAFLQLQEEPPSATKETCLPSD